MKIRKFAVTGFLIAAMALFAPRAQAQTGAEYGAASSGVGAGSSGMGTEVGNSDAGAMPGSQTWGASTLGEDFNSRASAQTGSSGLSGESGQSRWPNTALSSQSQGGNTTRFSENSDRFNSTDRFDQAKGGESQLDGGSDRFPASAFQNSQGLDNKFNSGGLDQSYSH
jgi:hypothetical protein